jgi:hypothetical protein
VGRLSLPGGAEISCVEVESLVWGPNSLSVEAECLGEEADSFGGATFFVVGIDSVIGNSSRALEGRFNNHCSAHPHLLFSYNCTINCKCPQIRTVSYLLL